MSNERPTNAYELCERVCEAIAAHPLNYYQDYWITRKRDLPSALRVPENECGTAYCRAGWMVQVADGRVVERVSRRAFELLGDVAEDGQFTEDIWHLFETFEGDAMDLTPGTPEYIAEGIAGLRHFMAKYEARLKATPIEARP